MKIKKNSSRPNLSSLSSTFAGRLPDSNRGNHLHFERLEDRTTPATLALNASGIGIYTGTGASDTLQITSIDFGGFDFYQFTSSDAISITQDATGTAFNTAPNVVIFQGEFLVGGADIDEIFVNMGNGNDSVTILDGQIFEDFIINGEDGNDVLTAIAPNTGNILFPFVSLNGNGGNDQFIFNNTRLFSPLGLPAVDGGTGIDLLDFSGDTNLGRRVDLVNGTATGLGGSGEVGEVLGIENVNGGSFALGDTLLGNSQDNVLNGGVGSDIIGGDLGNDTLIGGTGNDTYLFDQLPTGAAVETDIITELAGGGTADALDFRGLATDTAAVDLTSDNPIAVQFQGATPLRFVRMNASGQAAFMENAFGGASNDLLIGNAANNSLVGGLGDDTLQDGDGSDTMVGGTGVDSVAGGNDTYVFDDAGSSQTDVINEPTNNGLDTLDFRLVSTAITVNLTVSPNAVTMTNRSITILPTGVNIENVIGGTAADLITGNALANSLVGGNGNDTINGGDGNDTISGGGETTHSAVAIRTTRSCTPRRQILAAIR